MLECRRIEFRRKSWTVELSQRSRPHSLKKLCWAEGSVKEATGRWIYAQDETKLSECNIWVLGQSEGPPNQQSHWFLAIWMLISVAHKFIALHNACLPSERLMTLATRMLRLRCPWCFWRLPYWPAGRNGIKGLSWRMRYTCSGSCLARSGSFAQWLGGNQAAMGIQKQRISMQRPENIKTFGF